MCFAADSINEQMAASLLKNKGSQVIKHHNDLHGALSQMRTAADIIGITPALRTHPISSEPIAVALHTLAHARDTRMVSDAIQLYVTYQNHVSGAQKAGDFLKLHPADCRGNVPAIMWQKLEMLAAEQQQPTGVAAPAPAASSAAIQQESRAGAELAHGAASSAAPMKAESTDAPGESDAPDASRLKRRRK